MAPSSSSSSSLSSFLLVLNRSDLDRQKEGQRQHNRQHHNHQKQQQQQNATLLSSSLSSSSSSSSSPRSLVLMKFPKNEIPTHIQATSKRATLMTQSGQSYKLIKVGTSNTLVVWEPPVPAPVPSTSTTKNESLVSHGDDDRHDGRANTNDNHAIEPPSPKRLKRTHNNDNDNNNANNNKIAMNIQPCQLVIPGGSGASFIICQPQPLPDPQVLWKLLPRSTRELMDYFQCSRSELYQVLNPLNVISTSLKTTSNNSNVDDNDNYIWEPLSESEIWSGRSAVLQTLCEEYDNDNDEYTNNPNKNNSTIQNSQNNNNGGQTIMIHNMEQMIRHVQERLVLLQQSPSTTTRSSSSSVSSSSSSTASLSVWRYALAKKFCQLATTTNNNTTEKNCNGGDGGGDSGNIITINVDTISKWVVQDLLRNYHATAKTTTTKTSTTTATATTSDKNNHKSNSDMDGNIIRIAITDFLDDWKARLPLSLESTVSLEWFLEWQQQQQQQQQQATNTNKTTTPKTTTTTNVTVEEGHLVMDCSK